MLSKLLLSVLSACMLFDKSEAGWAGALFNGSNNISGFVIAGDGYVIGYVDISGLAADNYSAIGGPSCLDGGMSYHIHELWEHNNTVDKIGGTACGAAYTGGHWDPWLACGSATGNTYCASKGGCVNGSSVLGPQGYTCDYFDDYPYSCEVGDWSGKYGKVSLNESTQTLMFAGYSPYEVDGSDLRDYSVVFHCNSGARAFCSPFTAYTNDSLFNLSRPTQDADSDMKVALMGNSSMIYGYYILYEDGTNYGAFRSGLFSDDCDMLAYRIYDDWDGNGEYFLVGDACDSAVGSFYDPTVSCAPDSNSIYCDYPNDGLCNDTYYNYTCNYNDAADRYLCAPGDLSGKFGYMYTSVNVSIVYEMDELMIDLDSLSGKSLVVQCADDWSIVGCARWMNVFPNFTVGATTTTTSSPMMSSMSSSSSSMEMNNETTSMPESSASGESEEGDSDSSNKINITFVAAILLVFNVIKQML